MEIEQLLSKRPALQSEIPMSALSRYDNTLRAATESNNTIGMYSAIGETFAGDGWTAKRLAGVLRNIGTGEVVVNINSPGGDVFEGLSIYNLLKAHPGKVTANIVGLAASAASFVAMAADEIRIGKAAAMMIHNTQSIAIGDRNVMRDAANWMGEFDTLLAEIYADRTGTPTKAVAKMLDAETWLLGQSAIDAGFADALLPADEITHDNAPAATNTIRDIEKRLRAAGLTRENAQGIIATIKAASRDSTQPTTPRDSDASKRSAFAELLPIFRKD